MQTYSIPRRTTFGEQEEDENGDLGVPFADNLVAENELVEAFENRLNDAQQQLIDLMHGNLKEVIDVTSPDDSTCLVSPRRHVGFSEKKSAISLLPSIRSASANVLSHSVIPEKEDNVSIRQNYLDSSEERVVHKAVDRFGVSQLKKKVLLGSDHNQIPTEEERELLDQIIGEDSLITQSTEAEELKKEIVKKSEEKIETILHEFAQSVFKYVHKANDEPIVDSKMVQIVKENEQREAAHWELLKAYDDMRHTLSKSEKEKGLVRGQLARRIQQLSIQRESFLKELLFLREQLYRVQMGRIDISSIDFGKFVSNLERRVSDDAVTEELEKVKTEPIKPTVPEHKSRRELSKSKSRKNVSSTGPLKGKDAAMLVTSLIGYDEDERFQLSKGLLKLLANVLTQTRSTGGDEALAKIFVEQVGREFMSEQRRQAESMKDVVEKMDDAARDRILQVTQELNDAELEREKVAETKWNSKLREKDRQLNEAQEKHLQTQTAISRQFETKIRVLGQQMTRSQEALTAYRQEAVRKQAEQQMQIIKLTEKLKRTEKRLEDLQHLKKSTDERSIARSMKSLRRSQIRINTASKANRDESSSPGQLPESDYSSQNTMREGSSVPDLPTVQNVLESEAKANGVKTGPVLERSVSDMPVEHNRFTETHVSPTISIPSKTLTDTSVSGSKSIPTITTTTTPTTNALSTPTIVFPSYSSENGPQELPDNYDTCSITYSEFEEEVAAAQADASAARAEAELLHRENAELRRRVVELLKCIEKPPPSLEMKEELKSAKLAKSRGVKKRSEGAESPPHEVSSVSEGISGGSKSRDITPLDAVERSDTTENEEAEEVMDNNLVKNRIHSGPTVSVDLPTVQSLPLSPASTASLHADVAEVDEEVLQADCPETDLTENDAQHDQPLDESESVEDSHDNPSMHESDEESLTEEPEKRQISLNEIVPSALTLQSRISDLITAAEDEDRMDMSDFEHLHESISKNAMGKIEITHEATYDFMSLLETLVFGTTRKARTSSIVQTSPVEAVNSVESDTKSTSGGSAGSVVSRDHSSSVVSCTRSDSVRSREGSDSELRYMNQKPYVAAIDDLYSLTEKKSDSYHTEAADLRRSSTAESESGPGPAPVTSAIVSAPIQKTVHRMSLAPVEDFDSAPVVQKEAPVKYSETSLAEIETIRQSQPVRRSTKRGNGLPWSADDESHFLDLCWRRHEFTQRNENRGEKSDGLEGVSDQILPEVARERPSSAKITKSRRKSTRIVSIMDLTADDQFENRSVNTERPVLTASTIATEKCGTCGRALRLELVLEGGADDSMIDTAHELRSSIATKTSPRKREDQTDVPVEVHTHGPLKKVFVRKDVDDVRRALSTDWSGSGPTPFPPSRTRYTDAGLTRPSVPSLDLTKVFATDSKSRVDSTASTDQLPPQYGTARRNTLNRTELAANAVSIGPYIDDRVEPEKRPRSARPSLRPTTATRRTTQTTQSKPRPLTASVRGRAAVGGSLVNAMTDDSVWRSSDGARNSKYERAFSAISRSRKGQPVTGL